MHKILVLGVGPGSPDYLLPATIKQAERCDILVGGRRNLELFELLEKEKMEITGDISSVLSYIREHYRSRTIGVLVSGDPGFFSLLPRLEKEFGREALEVYPGISAVQYLFARLNLTWDDALILSLHGRNRGDLAELVRGHEKVALLTDPVHTPAVICTRLLREGIKDKEVWLGENLTYEDEKITAGSLEDFAVLGGCGGLNVMVIMDV